MRLQGQAQLGYFPTPLSQIELIATWLRHAGTPGCLTRYFPPGSRTPY